MTLTYWKAETGGMVPSMLILFHQNLGFERAPETQFDLPKQKVLNTNSKEKKNMSFELLNVKTEIVKALNELGINTPTLIQEKAIPLVKAGKDVIGMSKTGSGKTIAFGVPILEKIVSKAGLQVLIMAPTRELAVQIANELRKFCKYMHCTIATVYGGVSIMPQIQQIARSEIVVGTPGRLLDHLQRRTLNLSRITCFILDEADKMVEMGFIEDVKRIINCKPNDRQILLFGATISEEINMLKQRYMREPVVARAETYVKEDFLEQCYYNILPHEKFSLLVHLLKKEETKRAIIFCSTRSTVELVAKNLRSNNIKADMIHGKLSQNRRLELIDDFNKGKISILVASAVAARGLDIKDITHVFNYDLSRDPQEYIHRIGRTARAGETGKAITLLSQNDHDVFNAIRRRYDVKVRELPREEFIRLRFEARSPRFGEGQRFGNRRFERGDRPRFRLGDHRRR